MKKILNSEYKNYDALGERLETLVSGQKYVALLSVSIIDEADLRWSVQSVDLDEWTTIEEVRLNKNEIEKMAYSYFESFRDAMSHYHTLCDYEKIRLELV